MAITVRLPKQKKEVPNQPKQEEPKPIAKESSSTKDKPIEVLEEKVDG
jgi:hypothetical protein